MTTPDGPHDLVEPDRDSWAALNEYQATTPIRFTSNEDGGPLARGRLTAQPFIPEADLELEPASD